MKKRILCLLCIAMMLMTSFTSAFAFTTWESPRYIQSDVYKTPWTESGNPYVTYYAPWLRQLHLMTATEAENNKTAGIVGGEACQMIRQIAISPKDSNIMYLCSDTSGVYKTTDGGKHWYSTTNNAAGHDARGLLCDKSDKDTVYVYMSKVGVHRSVDGGYTWEQIVEDTDRTQNASFRSNTIVQDDAGNTYMCVGSGVWKLERGAEEAVNLTKDSCPWLTEIENPNDTAEFLDMAVSPNGKIIYACCTVAGSDESKNKNVKTGLYISKDGGESWEICQSAEDGSTYSEISTLAIDPGDSTCDTLYVGMRITPAGSSQADEYKLYKLTNGGKTYTEVYRPINNSTSKKHKYFYGLKFGPENSSGIYPLYLHLDQANYPLRVSYNYADSSPDFSEVYSASHNIDKDTIRESYTGWCYQAYAPDMKAPGRVVFASSGVHEKSAEGTFKRITSGYSGACATDIAFDKNGKMFMSVTDVATFVCTEGSAYTKDPVTGKISYPTFRWQDKEVRDTQKYGVHAIFDPNNSDHVTMFVGYSNGDGDYYGIRQSSDGGIIFAGFNTDARLSKGDAIYKNAKVLCYDKDNKNTIYSSYHNSYDNGKTWTSNSKFLLDVHPDNTKLQVAIEGTDANTVLYKTTDGGTSWTEVGTLGFSDITDADFDLNDPSFVWITRETYTKKNAFVRVDLTTGAIEDYTQKFAYKAFSHVEINPKDPNHMLVTSYPGRILEDMQYDFKLAESTDGGKTWHTVTGLWGGAFNNIIFSPTTDEVFITGLAGTFIYDYEKYKYYQNIEFRYDGQSIFQELPRVNDSGVNVNNGSFIIAPEDLFKPANKKFTGWKINGEIYMPGEKVLIPD